VTARYRPDFRPYGRESFGGGNCLLAGYDSFRLSVVVKARSLGRFWDGQTMRDAA